MQEIPRRHVDACYLCGSQIFSPILCDGDLRFGYPGIYHVVACEACGFIFLADPPESDMLSRWYVEGYGSKDYSEPVQRAANLISLLRRLVKQAGLLHWAKRGRAYWRWLQRDQFDKLAPVHGRILDVGCGEGFLMHHLKKPGRELVGLEPSRAAAHRARELGFTVHENFSEVLQRGSALFDALILAQVIEHLEDPRLYLRDISGLLAPGGLLIIGCPNAASYLGEWFGRAWINWHLPFHLWHFTPTTIQLLLEAQGWSVQRLLTVTPPLWLMQTLLLWISVSRGAMRPTFLLSRRDAAKPPKALRGDCIFVVARRGRE